MAEYSTQGLLAISLDPGGVFTDMAANSPAHIQALLIDTPELSADTLVWLTKDRRSGWLGGS